MNESWLNTKFKKLVCTVNYILLGVVAGSQKIIFLSE